MRRPRGLAAVVVAVSSALGVAVMGITACSSQGSSSGVSCPNDLPASCPASPPSFSKDVEPVFEQRCFMCHTNGGPATDKHDFSTYGQIFKDRTDILTQVYGCHMPPPDSGHPTPEERATLLGWLVCSAPNN